MALPLLFDVVNRVNINNPLVVWAITVLQAASSPTAIVDTLVPVLLGLWFDASVQRKRWWWYFELLLLTPMSFKPWILLVVCLKISKCWVGSTTRIVNSNTLLFFCYTVSNLLLLILNDNLLFEFFLLLGGCDLFNFVSIELIVFGNVVIIVLLVLVYRLLLILM